MILSLLYISVLMLGFIASPIICLLGFFYGVGQGLTFTEIVKTVSLALLSALVSGFITFRIMSLLFNCGLECYLYGVSAGMILGGIVALIIQVKRYKKMQDQLSAYYRSMYEKRKNNEKTKRY